jgi:hypothetical protein
VPAWGLSEDGSRPVGATPLQTACEPALADGARFEVVGRQFVEVFGKRGARDVATRHRKRGGLI